MKTVFKVGMKVYDQIVFPDKQGVIIDIEDKNVYPVVVKVGKDNFYYRLDGAFNIETTPTLSTKPYKLEMQGFEQKAPVPTFEEVWEESEKIYEPKSEYDKEEYGGYPTQELADASEALRRLLFLRDYYNEGWQPDWNDNTTKYSIEVEVGEIVGRNHHCNARIMSFKTNNVRNKFLEDQKELLEIAKPLL